MSNYKQPTIGEINALGALFKAGRTIELERRARFLLAKYPKSGVVWNAIGISLQGQGKDATAVLQKACELSPYDASVMSNLGNALKDVGRFDDAIVCFRKATAIKPDFAEAHYNLGVIFEKLKRLEEALESYGFALKIKPDLLKAHNNLGNVLREMGRLKSAQNSFNRALDINPNFAEGHSNLGNVQKDLGELEAAADSFLQAVKIKPDFAEGYYNLGTVLQDLKRNDEAIGCYQKAVAIKPSYTEAHNNLGNTLKDLGRLDDAVSNFRLALECNPKYEMAYSNILFTLNYHPDKSSEDIFNAYKDYDVQYGLIYKEIWQTHGNSREARRRLKVGYVSPDFNQHAVRYFLEPLLAHHDKNKVEVYAYAELSKEDQVTSRYRSYVDQWVTTVGMSDDTLAERIRVDGIDILVDLAGHTAHNRLSVFARKPAPVSLSWLGYGYTTGLSAVDYFLTDEVSAPLGSEGVFSETPYRLSNPATVFRPAQGSGSVGPLPATKSGRVTFGTLSRSVRINHHCIRVWATIMNRVKGARLVINSHDFKSESMQDTWLAKFKAHGIDRDRLEIGFQSPPWDVLRGIDIGLDCFPHNSGTTLYETLFMGVPFITLAGRPSVGRLGSSILEGLGHPEWIAQSEDNYIEIAVALASNLERLAAIREGLRHEMQMSALMDEAGFTQKVEAAYRDMWVNWCGNERSYEKINLSPKLLSQEICDEMTGLLNNNRYLELESQSLLLISKYPKSGYAWKVLGTALQMQGKNALPASQKASELLPDDAETFNNLGVALQGQNNIKDAIASYLHALKIKPDYLEAHYNLGVLAVQIKQYGIGLYHLKSALEANLGQVRYWLSYIDALIQADQTDAAQVVLVQARQQGLKDESLEVLACKLAQLKNSKLIESEEIETTKALGQLHKK